MRSILWAACGTLFTFAMTALGSALVFFFRRSIGETAQRLCFGFASGVMAAASVFSLLSPAIEQTRQMGASPWLVPTAGFLVGALVILGFDALARQTRRIQAAGDSIRRRTLLLAAVTLHNIPEGMAVGLAFALAAQEGGAGFASATALALGIGIQNFPEGAAISLPLRQSGMSRVRSFVLGVLSGVVEPLFGVLVVLLATAVRPMMPAMMAFAAGAMMLVVIGEMIPEAAQGREGTLAAIIGYAIMMALDVGLA